jgi:hypothetical protein
VWSGGSNREMEMGMRKSTRREIRKLREMVWWAYRDVHCCFCHEPLLSQNDDDTDDEDNEIVNAYGDGDGEASPMNLDVTLHHRNGNHEDNRRKNQAWSHRRCHKAHHLTERHKAARRQAGR